MRKLGVFLAAAVLVVLASSAAQGQATNDYRSVQTGNWGTLATWARYNGATWVTPTAGQGIPTSASGVITIQSPHIVTVAASVTVDFTIVNVGGQITVNSGQTLTIANGAGTDMNVSGVLKNSGTITNTGTLSFASGGTYEHAQNGGTIPAATWNAASTCLVTGTVATLPLGFPQAFGNLIWNCVGQTANATFAAPLVLTGALTIQATGAGKFRPASGTTTVAGNYSQSGGFVRLAGTSTRTLTVGGNFSMSGGTIEMNDGGAVATINVAGNFSHTTGTIQNTNNSVAAAIVFIAGTHTYTSGGTFTNQINFTVNSGSTLLMGTSVVGSGSTGTFTVASGGTLGIGDAGGITTSGASGNVRPSGTRTYTTGANYTYNGSANQAVGNGLTANNPLSVTIANTGGPGSNSVTLGAALTLTGTLTVTSGTLDPNGVLVTGSGAANTLSVSGTLIVDASTFALNYTGFETRTLNAGSTVEYQNATPTLDGSLTYQNLTFSGTGTTGNPSADLIIQGTLANTGSGTLNFSARNVTLSGTVAANNIARFTTTGNVSMTKTAGTATFTGNVGGSGLIINGTGGTLNLGAGLTHTFTGTWTRTAGTLDGGSSTLRIGGSVSGATGTFTAGTGTVEWNAAGAQTVAGVTYNILNFTGGGTKTLGAAATVNATSTIDPGVTFDPLAFTLSLSSATLNVNGTLDFSNATGSVTSTVATSVLTIGATGLVRTINANGVGPAATASLIATAGFTTTSIDTAGTVEYNRAIATTQIVTDRNYNNLTITGSTLKTWTLAAGRTVNSNLTINTTAPLTMSGTNTVDVKGNWSNSGTFTRGTETFAFSGSVAQTIGGSVSTAFRSLTINNGAGVSLNTAGSLNGVLTLTSDLTATATLTQTGSTSAGNGDVVGTVSRSDVGTITRAFGNPLVRITNANILVGSFTVNLVKGSTPIHLATGVRREYTLTNGAAGAVNATVRLHYLGSELNSNTESTLELYRSGNGGLSFGSQGATTRGTAVDTDRWVEKTGITGFSPWAIAGPSAPTAVEMVGYAARAGRDGKTLLQWETGREVNNLGFNIYREEDAKRVQINKSLIVGSGLMASPGTVMTAGRSYAWQTSVDQAKESIFWLEEIDLSGYTVWHGPIVSQSSDAKMSAREQSIADQTVTLSDMATEGTYNGVTRPVESLAKTAKAQTMKVAAAVISPKPPIARITLKQEGWYRVGQPQLVAAGLNPSVNPNSLQLFADGTEIAISVITNNGAFDSTSAIEFYGQGIDTPSTDTHIYSLVAGSAGLRIQNAQGQGGLPPSNSFLYAVERKDRLYYLTGVHNGDAENFFGTPVGAASVDQAITLKNLDATAPGQATIEVGMQGFTFGTHVVTVSLNGNPIGTIQYDNQAQGVLQLQVPNNLLAEGQNLVTLTSQQGGQDVSLVDHIRVSYWHSYAADGNALKLTATANQEVSMAGFTSGDVKVLDVTNPLSPTLVAATVTSQENSPTFVVTVSMPGTGTRTLLALGGDQTRSVLRVAADKPSAWRSSANAADLVIITHESLMDSYAPLKALRQSQGLKVALVDVEDLYDEFNSGNKSPQAIKDFLAYARTNWKTAPRFVLLAGSASYDPKNYNGLGAFDLVPTKLIDTVVTETASDDWFADFDLDGIAEMAVGRLPTPTSEEAQTTVTKLAVYDNSEALNSALLVADGNLNFDFEAANSSLASLFPGSITVQQIDRGQVGTATAKQQLLDGIASGQKIVNYVGHGSPSTWRDNLLTAADALALTNTGRYPLFVAMACLNGEFQHPQLNPLATALMNSREGGAIAVWASSGMTAPADQATMNQAFYTLLFQSNRPVNSKSSQAAALTLGEITNNAKSAVGDADVRRTWILFGDPSMRLK